MWDPTLQIDLLQELPAEYSTEGALVDLVVGFLIWLLCLLISGWSHILNVFPISLLFRIILCKLCGQMKKTKRS
jgi:hypothetical protein